MVRRVNPTQKNADLKLNMILREHNGGEGKKFQGDGYNQCDRRRRGRHARKCMWRQLREQTRGFGHLMYKKEKLIDSTRNPVIYTQLHVGRNCHRHRRLHLHLHDNRVHY